MARILQAVILSPQISFFKRKYVSVLGLKPNKDLAFINELFEAGKIKPVIDGPCKLSEVPEIIQYFGEGKHKGKVVITLEHNNKT